jgi:hypothetical protein
MVRLATDLTTHRGLAFSRFTETTLLFQVCHCISETHQRKISTHTRFSFDYWLRPLTAACVVQFALLDKLAGGFIRPFAHG